MASIQRSVQRLGVRRQRQLLASERSPFVGVRIGHSTVGEHVAAFTVLTVLLLALNRLIAMWLDVPPYLGLRAVLMAAGAATGLLAVLRQRDDGQAALPAAVGSHALAAAVARELVVAQQRRAELERVSVVAQRAYGLTDADRLVVLVLDGGPDGCVCLRGPLLEASFAPDAVPQRVEVERLRWTGAILGLSGHGAPLELRPLPVEDAAALLREECVVGAWESAPVPIAAAVREGKGGYRG